MNRQEECPRAANAPGLLRRMRSWSLGRKSGALAVVLGFAWAVASPFVWLLHGRVGLVGLTIAATLCFLGAQLALVWSWWFRDPEYLVVGSLGAMLPRIAVPLGGALILQISGGLLVEAGTILYLLYFYPIALCVEILVSLPEVAPTARSSEDSSSDGSTNECLT